MQNNVRRKEQQAERYHTNLNIELTIRQTTLLSLPRAGKFHLIIRHLLCSNIFLAIFELYFTMQLADNVITKQTNSIFIIISLNYYYNWLNSIE